jgi:hypothetical protein
MLQVKLRVPPVAISGWLYAVPTKAAGRVLVVIVNTEGSVTYNGAIVTGIAADASPV